MTALVLADLQEEEDEAAEACRDFRIDPPPVHRVVPAEEGAPLPATVLRFASFVFDLADKPVKVGALRAAPRTTAYRIERRPGVTRFVTIPEVETAEWQERERQRRARQVMPRRPKTYKSMSAKFKALVGEAE